MSARNFRKKIHSSQAQVIEFPGFKLEFTLNRKSIRRLYLIIKKEDGSLIVNAPRLVPISIIKDFISKKADWIQKAQKKILQKTCFEPDFINAEEIIFFGKKFKLQLITVNSPKIPPRFEFSATSPETSSQIQHQCAPSIKYLDLFQHFSQPKNYSYESLTYEIETQAKLGSVHSEFMAPEGIKEKNYKTDDFHNDFFDLKLFAAPSETRQQKEMAYEKFCRRELLEFALAKLPFWQEIIGVKAKSVRIRKMRTRHGTCNVRTAVIWLSLDLVKRPFDAIEYVLVHELVHLLEPSHNRRFVAFMNRFLPDWKTRKAMLG